MGPALRGLLIALMLLLCVGFVSIVAALGARRAPARASRPDRVTVAAAGSPALSPPASWPSSCSSATGGGPPRPRTTSRTSTSRSKRPPTPSERPADAHAPRSWWIRTPRDDFVPDHGHPMHLFVVSPALDRLWHLHPEPERRAFEQRLPEVAVGGTSFSPTSCTRAASPKRTGRFKTEGIQGAPLTGDDSAWTMPAAGVAPTRRLPDGGRIVWVRDAQPLAAGSSRCSRFVSRMRRAGRRPISSCTWGCRVTRFSSAAIARCSPTSTRRDRRRWRRSRSAAGPPVKRRTAVKSRARARTARAPLHAHLPVWVARARRLQDLRPGEAQRPDRHGRVRRSRRGLATMRISGTDVITPATASTRSWPLS